MKYVRLLSLLVLMITSNGLIGMSYFSGLFKTKPKVLTNQELQNIAAELYVLKALLVHSQASFNEEEYKENESILKGAIQDVKKEQTLRLTTKMTDDCIEKKIDKARIDLLEKRLKATLPIEKWQDEVVRLGDVYESLLNLKNNRFSDIQLQQNLNNYEESLKALEKTNKAPSIQKQIKDIEDQYGEQINKAVENNEIASYEYVVKNAKFNFYESSIDFSSRLVNNVELGEQKQEKKEISYEDQLIEEFDAIIQNADDSENVNLDIMVFLLKFEDARWDGLFKPSIMAAILNVLRNALLFNKKYTIKIISQNNSNIYLKTNGVINHERLLDEVKLFDINNLKKIGFKNINEMKSTFELYKNENGKFSKMNDYSMREELTILKRKHGIK